jgi:hypothetical protein
LKSIAFKSNVSEEGHGVIHAQDWLAREIDGKKIRGYFFAIANFKALIEGLCAQEMSAGIQNLILKNFLPPPQLFFVDLAANSSTICFH